MSIAHEDIKPDIKPDVAALRAEAFPVVDRRFRENSLRLLGPHTWVQTQRLLVRLARDPLTFALGLILPICFLLVLNVVLGDAIRSVTGHSALHGSVPMVTLVGAMSGASVAAVGLITERANGLLARLWVVPVHRASGLLARLSSEAVRVLVSSVSLLCVGLVLGLRFEHGALAILAWLCLPAVFGIAFATLVLTVALYWPSTALAEAIAAVQTVGLFFCTGFVPLDQYPQWIRPVVQHQPLSYAIDAMRGLSLGGPVLRPALATLLWSAGIAVVCVIPMIRGYRRASMRG
jgi:ABC-2 type transport system permease protein